jgi:hypothetical protein
MSSEAHHKQTPDPNKRNKRIGMFLLITPFVGLFLILFAYAVVSFVLTSIGSATGETTAVVAGGVVFVVWIIIGVPLGIFYLRKKVVLLNEEYDKRSGNGDATVAPSEVKRWSWGAFGLPVLWGIYHGVWIALLCFIPLVNFAVMIYLGIKGNELAWQRNRWKSIEDFHRSQRKWAVAGVIAFVVLTPHSLLSGLADLADENSAQQSSYSTTSSVPTANPSTEKHVFHYSSASNNFAADFPVQPTRTSESQYDSDLQSNIETVTYSSSSARGASFYVIVYDYGTSVMSTTNSDFNVQGALEGGINGLVNSSTNARIMSQNNITVDGRDAISFVIQLDQDYFEGFATYDQSSMYLVGVDHTDANPASPAEIYDFSNSFTFLQ